MCRLKTIFSSVPLCDETLRASLIWSGEIIIRSPVLISISIQLSPGSSISSRERRNQSGLLPLPPLRGTLLPTWDGFRRYQLSLCDIFGFIPALPVHRLIIIIIAVCFVWFFLNKNRAKCVGRVRPSLRYSDEREPGQPSRPNCLPFTAHRHAAVLQRF